MPISYKNKIYTTLGAPTDLSGNVVSATDSAGVPAKDYAVKGKTIVWNQLWDKSKYPATTTIKGITFTNNGDGTIIANGTATANAIFAPIGIDNPTSIVSGHKFLFTSCLSGGSLDTYYSDLKDVPGGHSFYDVGTGVIMTAASTVIGLRFNIRVVSGYTANNLVFKPQLFDLTQMFGAGNEPSTREEFWAYFNYELYPYNAGELKTIVPTSMEASGVERFQLLDKNKYPATTTIGGVTFTNNGDGTITVNGTARPSDHIYYGLHNVMEVPVGHKVLISGGVTGAGWSSYLLYDASDATYGIDSPGGGKIYTVQTNQVNPYIFVAKSYTVSNITFKPQLFDLTQMFGPGNEPTTPAEFWQKVPEKLYGYNPSAYKSVNIPSSKYFPDGMKSAGSVYDEINFLSQKAIKRVGVRPYQAGDENNTAVMTDKTNTVYELATPVETAITPPLQALPTYKGFTSFSAPNSLTQNGPLSVTYYAEGGTNPESGWLTSYKRKLYMGRSIEWNQLLGRTNRARVTNNGVTVELKDDGSYVVNGTATDTVIIQLETSNFSTVTGHKYFVTGCPKNGSMKTFRMSDVWSGQYTDFGDGVIFVASVGKVTSNSIVVTSGYTCTNLIYKPQLFDLTQMFGAGNEPTTPSEFWSYFDHKLYPYNSGETQPLFKISRKSQWGSVTVASLYVGENTVIPQIVRN